LPSAASFTVHQPSIAPPSAAKAPTTAPPNPEPDNRQAVRLIARADLLLEQGNIGAARNMLDRAAEMGSTEALFWLAETYDPLLLSARQTFGTQSDIAKARELYGKALAAGVSKAQVRLEELQQTGAR
jgi:TPR repeat protein